MGTTTPPVELADGRLVDAFLVHDLDELAQDHADAHGTSIRLVREAMAAVLADRLAGRAPVADSAAR